MAGRGLSENTVGNSVAHYTSLANRRHDCGSDSREHLVKMFANHRLSKDIELDIEDTIHISCPKRLSRQTVWWHRPSIGSAQLLVSVSNGIYSDKPQPKVSFPPHRDVQTRSLLRDNRKHLSNLIGLALQLLATTIG